MAYPIEKKLVVGITSTALFDFAREHEIYLTEGLEAFRTYQVEHRKDVPPPGAAFPFIKRLLHLNKIFPEQSPVEVVLLSRNDPEAGLRMMDAMPHYELDITRARTLLGWEPAQRLRRVLPRMLQRLVDDPGSWYHDNRLMLPLHALLGH